MHCRYMYGCILLLSYVGTAYTQTVIPDSVEAIVIHFKVMPPDTNEVKLETISYPLKEFYYFLWDRYVIVKEMWSDHSEDISHYRLYDLDSNRYWHCYAGHQHIVKSSAIPHVLTGFRIQEHIDTTREILGFSVYRCRNLLRGDTLTSWYTAAFGIQFYTFMDCPGVPLYYEINLSRGPVGFAAQSVVRTTTSGDFFNHANMPELRPIPSVSIEESPLRFSPLHKVSTIPLRKGLILPPFRGRAINNERIEFPPANSEPLAILFFEPRISLIGLIQRWMDFVQLHREQMPFIAVSFSKRWETDQILNRRMFTCPVLPRGAKIMANNGIREPAYIVVVNQNGIVHELIYPIKDDWIPALLKAMDEVLIE